jgi:DNA-binding NtrC family response regulator
MNAPNSLEGARILIADDEDLVLTVTADILESHGYHCDCVHRSDEAAELLSRNSYDLLVTDINMPGNRNLEFLRDRPWSSDFLPVLIITGFPTVPNAVECLRLGVVDYLVKPVQASELLEAAKSAIQCGRALRTVSSAREEFANCLNQMQEMESAFSRGLGRDNGNGALDWYLGEIIRQFANLSLSLMSTIHALQESRGNMEAEVCVLMNCPRLKTYQHAIRDAVDTLIQTKSSFKSRELGELRKRLQALLQS